MSVRRNRIRPRGSDRARIRCRGTARGTAFTASAVPGYTNEVTVTATADVGLASGGDTGTNITLQDIHEQSRVAVGLIREMNNRLKAVEEKTASMSTTLKEFNEYFKKYIAETFRIKGSRYEV
jgi:hypothetical protein